METAYQTEQQHPQHLHAVYGIDGLRISVSNADSSAAEAGLTPRELTLIVHGMLRLAGVPVIHPDDEVDAPTLHATVSVKKVVDVFSVSIMLELWDRVWLARQSHGETLHAATWRSTASLVSSRHELRDNMRLELGNLLTTFLNDYFAANRTPNRASA
jgi:hypothetical protein